MSIYKVVLKNLRGENKINLIGGLFTSIIGLGVLGLIVWFWVLVFTALVRANQALKLYVEKNK